MHIQKILYPLSNAPDEFYKILVVRGGVRQRVLRYSNERLIVARIDKDEELDYQYGKIGVDREVWEVYTFTAGDYLCYVEVDWQTEEINNFVLSC